MAKPAKPFKPVIATANDLATGAVVFRSSHGRWQATPDEADVAENDQDAAALQAICERDLAANRIVDLALIPIVRDNGAIRPVELREIIRAQGPTIAWPGRRV